MCTKCSLPQDIEQNWGNTEQTSTALVRMAYTHEHSIFLAQGLQNWCVGRLREPEEQEVGYDITSPRNVRDATPKKSHQHGCLTVEPTDM